MIIQDGQRGYTAKVDEENRLYTYAVTEHQDKHSNTEGRYSSVYFEVTPVGADDYFFYLKNTGLDTKVITDIRISSSVATTIFVDKISGTPSYVTGSDPEITNRNLGSSMSPDVTLKYDTNITGLTREGLLFFQECPVADTMYHLKTTSTIYIPQGQSIAIRRSAATGLLRVVVSLSGTEE